VKAGEHAIEGHCAYCARPVRFLYSGTYRRGAALYARFKVIDQDGDGDQAPHRCPRSWRVFSTRESASTSFTKQGTRVGRLGQRAAG
jgi:hypothetical protein